MNKAKLATLGTFAVATTAVSLTYNTSFVVDRPIQSSALGLFTTGLLILVLGFSFPGLFGSNERNPGHATIPLKDLRKPYGSRESSPISTHGSNRVNLTTHFLVLLITVIIVCLRVEVFRRTLKDGQCTIPGIEALIPFILSVYDYWSDRSEKKQDDDLHGPGDVSRTSKNAVFDCLKCVGPPSLMSGAGVFASIMGSSARSTYICPTATGAIKAIPCLQLLGLLLDCFVLISVEHFTKIRKSGRTVKGAQIAVIVGSMSLLASVVLSIAGAIVLFQKPEYRTWTSDVGSSYLQGLAWLTITISVILISSIRLLANVSSLALAMIIHNICISITGVKSLGATVHSFPPTLGFPRTVSLILFFSGLFSYASVNWNVRKPKSQVVQRTMVRSRPALYALFTLVSTLVFFAADLSDNIKIHPVDMLIKVATGNHNDWLAQATTSQTLSQAVQEYRRRYVRRPPPGFDKWYEYATIRNSIVIDDYDSIHHDLLPFWAFSPQAIREHTREILSDPWNEVAEISIRSGTAEIGPSVLPTHRWMVEGAIAMLQGFVEWLPDMDLAFNINDESRVAIPYKLLENYRRIGEKAERLDVGKDTRWSNDRAQSWPSKNELPPSQSRFKDFSFTNTFYSHGSISCPPNSPARRNHVWDARTLYNAYLKPHSTGSFVGNWTLAASPCHQPDLANLHGFYLCPAAFKTATELLPVFSQSKAHGYADILYPSPWNYMDKVKYDPSSTEPTPNDLDPPFSQKKNTLFWRGATSEGLSNYGTWKGMMRQRLVHLANNATFSVPILLPNKSKHGNFRYQYLSPISLSSHPHLKNLTLDISIVDGIARCRGPDCTDQESEFSFASPVEFQSHWQNRYLMDVDGAGFSGRFLPFLQSRSLPFKAALFREWYDSRITAWKHFVPIDIRLHGLWSTLGYFGGGWGDSSEDKGLREAEKIAEGGREWAGKVLRKEDMEIYFFRLLLEVGRLTDDRRDEIGFEL